MPRPKYLEDLFKPENPPPHLDTVGAYECFYVTGLKDVLKSVGVKPKRKSFKPHLKHAVKEAKKMKWHEQIPADGLWSKMSDDQARRALSFNLLTVPKAAMAILIAEMLAANGKRRKKIDVYGKVRLVPALSYISGLSFEEYEKFKDAVSKNAPILKECGSVEVYMKQSTGQHDEAVFDDMVRGKTVSEGLAADFLKMLKKHRPSFSGTVEDDHFTRKQMIKKLRERDNDGNPKLKRYAKKISSSEIETFRE